MTLIDSGFLIAVLDSRDTLHARARAWAPRGTPPLIVTEYVIWETVNFASPTGFRPKVHALVSQIRSGGPYQFIPASSDRFDDGLAMHLRRADKQWSLTDCISFIVMERRGITRALAYDHHFEQAGFEALLRRDPPA